MGVCCSAREREIANFKARYEKRYLGKKRNNTNDVLINAKQSKPKIRPNKLSPIRYLRDQRPVNPDLPPLGELEINPWVMEPRESYRIVLGKPTVTDQSKSPSSINPQSITVSPYENDVFYPDLYSAKESQDTELNTRIRRLLAEEDSGKNVFSGKSILGSIIESNPFGKASFLEREGTIKGDDVENEKEGRKTKEEVGKIAQIIEKQKRNATKV